MIDITQLKALHEAATPGPWEWSKYTKLDGDPIESVEDVAETLSVSAMRGEGAFLFGGSANDLVTFYSGNGPTSRNNSELLCYLRNNAPNLIARLEAADRMAEALEKSKTLCGSIDLGPCHGGSCAIATQADEDLSVLYSLIEQALAAYRKEVAE